MSNAYVTFDFTGVIEKKAWSVKTNAYSKSQLSEMRDLLKEGKNKSIPRWTHSMACQTRSCSNCRKACKVCMHCRWNEQHTRNRYPCIVSPCTSQWNPQVSTLIISLHPSFYFVPPPQITTDAVIKPTPDLFDLIRGSALTDKGGMIESWLKTGFLSVKGDKKHFIAVMASGLVINYPQAKKTHARYNMLSNCSRRVVRFMNWLLCALEDAYKAGVTMAKLHTAFYRNRTQFEEFFRKVGKSKVGETSFEKVISEYKRHALPEKVFRDYVVDYKQLESSESDEGATDDGNEEWQWSGNTYYMYRRGAVKEKTRG